jgi:tRNA (guanine37-N1)-methyltransferase
MASGMTFTVLSLFPELLRTYFACSIPAKAVSKGLLSYRLIDIRDYATDRHRTCDDAPYGGGAGMVLKPDVLGHALDSVQAEGKRTVYPTPSGKPLKQAVLHELAQEQDVVIICGRYEGVDQRILDTYVTDEISIGDYVISSGELAALVLIDGVFRLIDGAITRESLDEESFSQGLLEYPQYTRPEVFQGMRVPEVLLSGHHEKIRQWRLEKSIEKTLMNRPDLLENAELTDSEKMIRMKLEQRAGGHNGSNQGD